MIYLVLIIYLFAILLVIMVAYAFFQFGMTFSEPGKRKITTPLKKEKAKKIPKIKQKTPEIKEKTPVAEPIEDERVKQLQLKINSVRTMLNDLDNKFQTGAITQDVYVEKKHFLSQKLGEMQAQLEQLQS